MLKDLKPMQDRRAAMYAEDQARTDRLLAFAAGVVVALVGYGFLNLVALVAQWVN